MLYRGPVPYIILIYEYNLATPDHLLETINFKPLQKIYKSTLTLC